MYLVFFPLNWKEFSLSISLSISMRKRVGIGGLLLWKRSYALHTVVMPSCCGMFVYRVVTSIDTKMKMMFSGTIVFSMKLIKSVESLRYESCSLPIGWSRLSTNDDMRSVETSQPDMIRLPSYTSSCSSSLYSQAQRS